MTTTTRPTTRTPVPARRPRLGQRARRAALVAHLVSVASWFGIDVVVAVLVGVGRVGDPQDAALAYRALGTFVTTPMFVAALATLATGLVLGLGTRWGLVRYWWVLVKLVLALVMIALVVTVLAPGMPEVVAHGERLAAQGSAPAGEVAQLVYPPVVSLSVLSLAMWLSIFTPWGLVRRTVSTKH